VTATQAKRWKSTIPDAEQYAARWGRHQHGIVISDAAANLMRWPEPSTSMAVAEV
jgi:hypothetical protein